VKISKTSKIGIVLVISFTVLVWGINFLKGRDIFRTERVFIARYKNVGGLEPSTVVQLNGLKIGYVREVYFSDDLSGDLIVKIAIFNKFPLPVGTTAEIANSDLLGSKIVKLSLGKSALFYQHNDTIKTKIESDLMSQVTEQIAPIKAKAERLIVSLDSIVSGVSLLLNSDSRRNISKSIEQISLTMGNLERISSDLSDQLNDDSRSLGNILSKFSSISDSINPAELKSTLTHLNKSAAGLETILSNINNSNGTLGMILKDSTLYSQLYESGQNLNRLLIDLKTNPHRYLKISAINFGKEVYLAPAASYRIIENIDFKVFLFNSKVKIPLESSLFQGITNLEEIQDGSKFLYFAGEDKSYEKIRMVLNKVQLSFPQASLRAYENKEEISLKKALKICSK
jgi:phospholipid/cholesterol/gamma-HCH transport system substrate-binding protein